SGSTIQAAGGSAGLRTGLSGIEREIVDRFTTRSELHEVLKDTRVQNFVTANYENRLQSLRLIPNAFAKRKRHELLALAIRALASVGGAKLWIALSAGRSNVMFLIVLMVMAAIAAIKVATPYRTSLGNEYLAAVRQLFSRLRDRAATIRPGGGSRDLLWLTALFGAAAVPTTAFPLVRDFWPKRGGSDGGSSCGSSGGGCGGGGGGCGGCGS